MHHTICKINVKRNYVNLSIFKNISNAIVRRNWIYCDWGSLSAYIKLLLKDRKTGCFPEIFIMNTLKKQFFFNQTII